MDNTREKNHLETAEISQKLGISDSRHPQKRVPRNIRLAIAHACENRSPNETDDNGHSTVHISITLFGPC